jgi:uncharacterized damage-inducible protein DinB
MTATAHYRMFGHYNACANNGGSRRSRSSRPTNIAPIGAPFFGSVHVRLNDLLVTDRIWMRCFTGDGGAPDRLDAILSARSA